MVKLDILQKAIKARSYAKALKSYKMPGKTSVAQVAKYAKQAGSIKLSGLVGLGAVAAAGLIGAAAIKRQSNKLNAEYKAAEKSNAKAHELRMKLIKKIKR